MAGKRFMKILRAISVLVLMFIVVSYAEAVETKKTTVKDMAGRNVVVPSKPARIVALGPGALRFIVYMNAFSAVAGIEEIEKNRQIPAGRPYSISIYEKTPHLPSVGEGGSGRLPDFEKLISVKPDIVFVMGFDASNIELIHKKTGLPVVSLSIGTGAFKKTETYASLRLIGKIMGKEKRAEELINFINKAEQDLIKRTSSIPEAKRPSVYIGAVSYKGTHGITSTEGFYLPVEWVNGRNVVNELKKHGHIFIDKEKLLLWNPDIILLDSAGLNLINVDYQKNLEFYRKLKAVREGRIYTTMPYNHYNTNIDVAIANAYFAGKVLYPEKFKDMDPVKKADEIFKFFNGIAVFHVMEKEFKGFKSLVFREGIIDVR